MDSNSKGVEPDELRYKEFKLSLRGYSADQVDDLLDSVADELEGLRAERDRLSGELDEARGRIEQYESLESSIQSTLAQAERAASDYQEAAKRDAESTVEAARREAEILLHDAETRARRMLAETSSKVERVQDSYEALRQTRSSFDADLRGLLNGYLQLLDDTQAATVREIEAPLSERLDTDAISEAHAAAEEEHRAGKEEPDEEYGEDDADVELEAEAAFQDADSDSKETVEESLETDTREIHEADAAGDETDSSEEDKPRRGRFPRRRG